MAKGPKSRDAARKGRATSARSKSAAAPKRGHAAKPPRAETPKPDDAVVGRATGRRSGVAADASSSAKAKPSAAAATRATLSETAARIAKPLAAKPAKAKPSKAKAVKAQGARAAARKPKRAAPKFLAAELGHPIDHEGEPIGAGSKAASTDVELQTYTLKLWRQMQSRRGTNLQLPAMERAGVTIDQIWTAGVTETLTTSSTPDEVRRYRQKLLFRANMLEAILAETVQELHRLGSVESVPPRQADGHG